MFYIGCPLWGYKDWVGTFFPSHTPPADFLRLYSHKLTCVEGNTTFYATPSAATITHWVQETPPTFRFCPKISRAISHTPGLDTKKAPTLAFVERMRGLGSRLGPIFLQLPPSFAPTHLPELQAFLDFWPSDLRLAVEVRHPDFFTEPDASSLRSLLTQHAVAHVLMDTRPLQVGPSEERHLLQARERKPTLPLHIGVTTNLAFVRYIGHPRMPANEPFLEQWAQQVAVWLTQNLTVYVFCHCPFEVHSPNICLALYQRVKALVPLPALPWESEQPDSQPQQPRLF